jgi:hypothetical protein
VWPAHRGRQLTLTGPCKTRSHVHASPVQVDAFLAALRSALRAPGPAQYKMLLSTLQADVFTSHADGASSKAKQFLLRCLELLLLDEQQDGAAPVDDAEVSASAEADAAAPSSSGRDSSATLSHFILELIAAQQSSTSDSPHSQAQASERARAVRLLLECSQQPRTGRLAVRVATAFGLTG